MNSAPRILVLDWDFDTFDTEDDGDVLHLYDAEPDDELVIVEGWLWPGNKTERTLYQRVEGEVWTYRRVVINKAAQP